MCSALLLNIKKFTKRAFRCFADFYDKFQRAGFCMQILRTKKRISHTVTFPVEMFLENAPQSTKIFGLAVLRFPEKCISAPFMRKLIEQSREGGIRKGNHTP